MDPRQLAAQWWQQWGEGAEPQGQEALEKLLRAVEMQLRGEILQDLEKLRESR